MAGRTRQQIYLLLEQNTNREKPLWGLEKWSAQITCKSVQTAWCKRSARVTAVRITSEFSWVIQFLLRTSRTEEKSLYVLLKTLKGTRFKILKWKGSREGSYSVSTAAVAAIRRKFPYTQKKRRREGCPNTPQPTVVSAGSACRKTLLWKWEKNGRRMVKAH